MKHKTEILRLRAEGKSYGDIASQLGCSKSLVCYHCGAGQKQKKYQNTLKFRANVHPFYRKMERFNRRFYAEKQTKDKLRSNLQKQLRDKLYDFWKKGKNMDSKITLEQLIEKFGEQTNCYLTGQPIDIYQPSTYEFDHIIPVSRGGNNSLDNLGIVAKYVNQAKGNMTPDEFIILCKQVLQHNGYEINKAEVDGVAPSMPEQTDTHD